jgi:ATP-binding cassette subfamily C (CFTR/MRP) protein 1
MRFPQATLKENVLFGQPYDDKKFWDVIESCGLAPDLDQLPAAEETGIGEKGINLSGESRTNTHRETDTHTHRHTHTHPDALRCCSLT